MAMMKITVAQADALLAARKMTRQAQKAARKRVYTEIRQQHAIPKAVKLALFVETPDNPLYCVIRNKATGKPLDNGIPEPVVTVAAMPAIPAEVPTKAPETAATPAKKAAKVKAPAPAQVAQKAPKTAAKPVAKVAAKPAKPVAKVAQEPAKEIEVRITVDGKRIRIGKAKDEAAKAKMIKAYKKEHGIA